jgi:putative transposase
MPYEYRKLAPQEREEVVEFRKQRGYPLHAPPHPYRKNGTYLITAANFEHVSVMLLPERRAEFQELLLNAFHEIEAEIVGWVILPNHYHILASVESLNVVSDSLRLLHGRTSYDWNLKDGLQKKRQVWYKFSDRMMRDEKQLNQTLNYIHYNPVKHGWVESVFAWEWSSIFMYENERGRDWLREQWKKHGPPANFGNDWDI